MSSLETPLREPLHTSIIPAHILHGPVESHIITVWILQRDVNEETCQALQMITFNIAILYLIWWR